MVQATIADIIQLIEEEPAHAERDKARIDERLKDPSLVAFFERVAPLLDAGWKKVSWQPCQKVSRRLLSARKVWLNVSPTEDNRLGLMVSVLHGERHRVFDSPEEILGFVTETEKELALLFP